MPSKDLTTTTNALGDYFGGASLNDYITQCARRSYISAWSEPFMHSIDQRATGLMFGWRNDVSGGEFAHLMAVRRPETSLESSDFETLKWRVVCHYLVDLVSEEGLSDLAECIKDNLEFYKPPSPPLRPRLTGEDGVRAKLGEKYERPAFQFIQE